MDLRPGMVDEGMVPQRLQKPLGALIEKASGMLQQERPVFGGEVVAFPVADESQAQVLKLATAKTVVCGGRGVGKKVNPKLYLAVGISGALQHMAGCSNANAIVAINTDQEAPIFKMSHIGGIGDFKGVLAGFNDEVRKMKG